jgi:hypothetical protein
MIGYHLIVMNTMKVLTSNFMFFYSFFMFFIACKEPKKAVFYKKPSFDNIGKMSYEKAVLLYGKPLEGSGVFNIDKDGLGGPRITLMKKYTDFPDIDVLEAVWRKDSVIDIMVWYKKEKNNWQPIDTIMYEHGTEF